MGKSPARRNNLGRGLSALLGDETPATDESPKNSERRTALPIEQLHPGIYQPRHNMDQDHINDLAASIREKGIIQPILVRSDKERGDYEIIAGERRWRAAQLAQLHEVPVIIRDLSDQETLEIALIENLQREDLSPLEEADAYARLMEEFSHTQEALSKVVGKSRSHVANTIRLLNLPDVLKKLVEAGQLTAGHARALLTAPDPVTLGQQVVKGALNVRQTEALVAKAQQRHPDDESAAKAKNPVAKKDADTMALERSLSAHLGLKVQIKDKSGKGSLSIHYSTLEQLDDILARLQ